MVKLLLLNLLAVGKRIHGVHDDGADPMTAPMLQHEVDDGNDIGQAFPGPRAGGEHVIVVRRRGLNCLGLMLVQTQGLVRFAFFLFLSMTSRVI